MVEEVCVFSTCGGGTGMFNVSQRREAFKGGSGLGASKGPECQDPIHRLKMQVCTHM